MSLVFISCGQRTPREKDLGEAIANLVKQVGLQPYFAEYEQDVESLARHIFTHLATAFGIIAVLHRRDAIQKGWRASVWAEQEIAIAAYRKALGQSLRVLAFIEEGVILEGARASIILNPIPFSNEAAILERVRTSLPSWRPPDPLEVGGCSFDDFVIPAAVTETHEHFMYRVEVFNHTRKRVHGLYLRIVVPDAALGRYKFNGAYTVEFDLGPEEKRSIAHPTGFIVPRHRPEELLSQHVQISLYVDNVPLKRSVPIGHLLPRQRGEG